MGEEKGIFHSVSNWITQSGDQGGTSSLSCCSVAQAVALSLSLLSGELNKACLAGF